MRLFSLELSHRSLSIFRILLATCGLINLASRIGTIQDHYTAQGVLPAGLVREFYPGLASLSIFMVSDTWAWQVFWLCIAGISLIALLVGFHSRIATCISWYLLMSLHSRNEMVVFGADLYLRLLFFAAIFLPLDRFFSVKPSSHDRPTGLFRNVPYVAQIFAVYLFAVLWKLQGPWLTDGSAVGTAFQMGMLALPPARWLSQFSDATRLLSYLTVGVEAIAPFLLIAHSTRVRYMGIVALLGLHLGIAATLDLYSFPWVCIVALVPFVPTGVNSASNGNHTWHSGRAIHWAWAVSPAIWIIWFNFMKLGYSLPQMPSWLEKAGVAIRLNQQWNLFARPIDRPVWQVFVGKTADNREVDVWHLTPVISLNPPKNVKEAYGGERWGTYHITPLYEDWRSHREHLARVLCRRWNQAYPDQPITQVRADIHYYPVRGRAPSQDGYTLWEGHCD